MLLPSRLQPTHPDSLCVRSGFCAGSMLPPVLPPARVIKITSSGSAAPAPAPISPPILPPPSSPPRSAFSEDDDESTRVPLPPVVADTFKDDGEGYWEEPPKDDGAWETIPIKKSKLDPFLLPARFAFLSLTCLPSVVFSQSQPPSLPTSRIRLRRRRQRTPLCPPTPRRSSVRTRREQRRSRGPKQRPRRRG